jgi:nucleoside-diphosphate-sugar epimerase
VSKLAGEGAAEAFADCVPITIVRPPIVLGPGDATGLALFKSIRRLRAFLVLGSDRRVSIIHVADLNNALIAAAQNGERLPARERSAIESLSGERAAGATSKSGCGRYYVAADEHPNFSELNRMVACAVNRPRAWRIRLPLAAMWATAVPGEIAGRITGKARYLSCERAREYTAGHWICSADKAKRELNFVPGAPLAERLKQTADWYWQAGWL